MSENSLKRMRNGGSLKILPLGRFPSGGERVTLIPLQSKKNAPLDFTRNQATLLSFVLLLFQHTIYQYQRQHCLGNRHDTGDDTGIVSPANGYCNDIPVGVPGLLGLCY